MAGRAVELIGSWGRRRRLADGDAEHAIEGWRKYLGVSHPVRRERVATRQVVDIHGRRGCSLVGVVCTADGACIYHTRALMGEDVLHELLHVTLPEWPEEWVVFETSRILGRAPCVTRRVRDYLTPAAGVPVHDRAASAP